MAWANVKWLSEIHLQEDRYLGNFQARWYRDLRGVGGTGEDTDPEHTVGGDRSHSHAREVGDRPSKEELQGRYQVFGFVFDEARRSSPWR